MPLLGMYNTYSRYNDEALNAFPTASQRVLCKLQTTTRVDMYWVTGLHVLAHTYILLSIWCIVCTYSMYCTQ